MKNKTTDRLFARLEHEVLALGISEEARPYYTIGSLKGYIEFLANKFPEVEQHIAEIEDFVKGQHLE